MKENLTCLLYTLMRDELVPGRLEKLVQDAEKHPGPYTFSKPHLAAYATELADRILNNGNQP